MKQLLAAILVFLCVFSFSQNIKLKNTDTEKQILVDEKIKTQQETLVRLQNEIEKIEKSCAENINNIKNEQMIIYLIIKRM